MSPLRAPRRGSLALAVVVCAGTGALIWAATARPTKTWTVNTTSDAQNGNCDTDCTLRDALALAGTGDTIAFGIANGHQTITLGNGLTAPTAVTIDGTSQPGFTGSPLIELNCDAKAITALQIDASFTTVKGLAIGNGCQFGISMVAGGNTIQGNFIGTDWAGAVGGGVTYGLIAGNLGGNNQIGGTTAAARNVIVGDQVAIWLNAGGNQVQGNYVNVDAAGESLLGLGKVGVQVGGAGNTIGGLGSGTRNVICAPGTSGDGILTEFDSATIIQNNFIGTNAAGTAALALTNGIHLRSIDITAVPETIGGTDPGTGNVISGATNAGIFIDAVHHRPPTIQGNIIGTDTTGSSGLPNKYGIYDLGSAAIIGGTTTPGSCTGACNVISGNQIGILEASVHPDGSAVPIQGNFIGLTKNGSPLGNTQIGIKLQTGTLALVGGTGTGTGNTIAFNGATNTMGFGGVVVNQPQANAIRANAIYSNGGLGIDLGGDGVTANDSGDGDFGANNLQNFPVLTSVVTTGSSTVVQGSLNSYASTTYNLDFFTNPACDPSGHGQGKTFLGSWIVTTDGTGNKSFTTAPLTGTAPAGQFVTATATDPQEDTSEFSACVQVVSGATPTPTPTPTPTVTPTPTATPTVGTPTATRTPAPVYVVPAGLDVDPSPNGSTSNGNGVLEPEEIARVRPVWENASSQPVFLSGVATSWTAPEGFYDIFDAEAAYGVIPIGEKRSCEGDDYELQAREPILPMYPFPRFRPATHWDAYLTESPSTGDPSHEWAVHIGESFDDAPTSFLTYRAIEKLLHSGFTSGCDLTRYCPNDVVSRAAMAIFIARALARGGPNIPAFGTVAGKAYSCTSGGQSLFVDIAPTDPFCKAAHYLALENVTMGCAPNKFCPDAPVTRDPMAAFIARALVAPQGGAGVPEVYTDSATGRSYSCDAASPDTHFTDVPPTDVFCKHVHFLWAKNVISGCSATGYCPDGEVTRGAMAKFLVNGFNLKF